MAPGIVVDRAPRRQDLRSGAARVGGAAAGHSTRTPQAGNLIAVSDDTAVQHDEKERFFGAARVVAGLTVVSRMLGLVRDMAIFALGATTATDVFWTAFSVPNLFRRLFGEGALSAAFVPVFTEVSRTDGWERARLVLANVMGWLAVILAGLLIAGELGLGLWRAIAPGPWDRQLLLQLLQIVLPFMVTVCLLALASAALNCKGHFAYPAFAPVILNVALIAAAAVVHLGGLGSDWQGLFVLSASVIVAGVVQLAGVYWLLRAAKLASLPSLRPLLPQTRRIARLMLPMLIPLGLLQFSAFFDRLYALVMTATAESPTLSLLGWSIDRPLAPGVVTCLYAANRLYQFPLGVLAISVATAVFPLFSRYAASNDTPGLRDATNRALRLSLFLGIPAGVAIAILASPVITLICRHGEFTADNVPRAAAILKMYSLGMWAYFCNHILLRAFFAMKDARTPLRVSCVLAALNALLVVVLIFTRLRSAGIGLATATTAALNALILIVVLRRRLGGLGIGRLLSSLGRTLAATAAMAAAATYGLHLTAERLGQAGSIETWPWPQVATCLAVAVAAGLAAFFLAAKVMGCQELAELTRRGRKRAQ